MSVSNEDRSPAQVRIHPQHSSTPGKNDVEEQKESVDLDRCGDDMNWYELRVDGKQPERRAHHTSFMVGSKMFIYGGYDIERGPMQTMWSFDTNNLGDLKTSDSENLSLKWQEIMPQGVKKPGKFFFDLF